MTAAPRGSLLGAGVPARAVAVHAGSPAIALRGAAPLQAGAHPMPQLTAPAMTVFNNDPESARIDPLRIIAVKARLIHCSSQWRTIGPSVVVGIAGFKWPP